MVSMPANLLIIKQFRHTIKLKICPIGAKLKPQYIILNLSIYLNFKFFTPRKWFRKLYTTDGHNNQVPCLQYDGERNLHYFNS